MIDINPNSSVFIHGGMHTPSNKILDLLPPSTTTYHIHLEGDPSHMQREDIRKVNFFKGANARGAPNSEYLPCPLRHVSTMFDQRIVDLDYAIVNVTPPHAGSNRVSLGCSADVSFSAIKNAKHVIAQINNNVPYTYGTCVDIGMFDEFVEIDEPLHVHEPVVPDADQLKIGELVASLISDRDVPQLGIGAIPNVVAENLGDKSVYIHSEMISDAAIRASKCIATSFAVGSQDLVDFLDNNRDVVFYQSSYINDYNVLSAQQRLISINSVTEVDFTGASVCDSINGEHYSGIGGQFDFVSGAFEAPNSKSILCLKSKTSSGKSRIVENLSSAATIPNYLVDYIVTENGIAHLKGKTLTERRKLLEGLL